MKIECFYTEKALLSGQIQYKINMAIQTTQQLQAITY